MARKMTKRAPREVLKELRVRAGVKAMDAARACGYGSQMGYLRYEGEKTWGDKPIPAKVIKPLISLLVGRGNPPVSTDELLSISEIKDLSKVVRASPPSSSDMKPGGSPQRAAWSGFGVQSAGTMPIRYRAERGVFVASDEERIIGPSQIAAAPDIPSESQFVVVVTNGHARKWFPAQNSQLHCVVAGEVVPAQMAGRVVVLFLPRGDTGLGEVVVAQAELDSDYGTRYMDGDGKELKGTLIGVVIGAYGRT